MGGGEEGTITQIVVSRFRFLLSFLCGHNLSRDTDRYVLFVVLVVSGQ